jgi:hypothetical protein
MSNFKGFFELQKPADLLEKLRHDHKRMQIAPMDTFAAFDFFVTGYHLLDWVYPNKKQRRRDEEKANVILQICSHIANGIKHFQATRANHKSVADVRVRKGGFQRKAFQGGVFQVEALVIKLDGQAASQFGNEIECLELASLVLRFWEKHPNMT